MKFMNAAADSILFVILFVDLSRPHSDSGNPSSLILFVGLSIAGIVLFLCEQCLTGLEKRLPI